MKKIILVVALLLSGFVVELRAQQDPQYTQYMYNMNIVNPAYAGSRGTLSIGLLGRTQWVGISDAPKTATLSIHAPVGKNLAAGFSAIADSLWPCK